LLDYYNVPCLISNLVGVLRHPINDIKTCEKHESNHFLIFIFYIFCCISVILGVDAE
jgi:hypothetical protein